jgi:hypothetical protein
MFGTDKYPNEAQQHRQQRDETPESTYARVFGIEQFTLARDDDEAPVFYPRRPVRRVTDWKAAC